MCPVDQLLRLTGPEPLQVALRLLVEGFVACERVLAEVLGGRELLDVEHGLELLLEILGLQLSGHLSSLLKSGFPGTNLSVSACS